MAKDKEIEITEEVVKVQSRRSNIWLTGIQDLQKEQK